MTPPTESEDVGTSDEGTFSWAQEPMSVSREMIDAITPSLAAFEAPGFDLTKQVGEQCLVEFTKRLYARGWIVKVNSSFNWGHWLEPCEALLRSPHGVSRADTETLRRILTLIFRKDRFNEGTIELAFDEGWIVAVLRRLAELRDRIPTASERAGLIRNVDAATVTAAIEAANTLKRLPGKA